MKLLQQKGQIQKPRQSSLQYLQDDLEASDSDEQLRKQQEIHKLQIIEQIKKKQNQRDFLVNANFSFDITDYFKFQQKQDQSREKTFFKYLSQKNYIAWLILLYSVLTTAMIPPWLMSIKANKLLRISWRCLLQLIIIVPFVLYEYRTASQKTLQMYKLNHIFNPKHMQKICIAAFTATFWVTTILTTIQWTYISHSMVLGSLTNFFLSIQRTFKGKNGYMEQGGQIIIIFGILLVMYDSASLIIQEVPQEKYNVYNPFYLTRQWWQRVLGDIGALCVGYCMSQLSKQTSDLKVFYPPYLAMLLNNILTCIFCVFSAFFFNGITFDFNSQNGVFGLFTQAHFTNFLYMSIILGLGVFVSFVMVSKMFPDPVVPALAMTLQPIISTVLFQVVGVQTMPGPFSCLGYIFIIPGVIVILMGNCMFTRFTDDDLAKKLREQDFKEKSKIVPYKKH